MGKDAKNNLKTAGGRKESKPQGRVKNWTTRAGLGVYTNIDGIIDRRKT